MKAQPRVVNKLKITILSTMLVGDLPYKGIGEWGFSALIEADGRKILFDCGERPETVLQNARELGIDLSDVPELIISHNHWDHVGGLLTLRHAFSKRNPKALARAHTAQGIFLSRPSPSNQAETNGLLPMKAEYESSGGEFIIHETSKELFPGIWFTGPVARVFQERNFSSSGKIKTAQGLVEDTIPEDASIVINTPRGLVIVSGCGHAGIVNTVECARKLTPSIPVQAIIGGLHLLAANDSTLTWTALKLREAGLHFLLAAHCTGIEATYRLRELAGLDRRRAVVGAVGSSFTLDMGIDPLLLSR